MLTDNQVLQVLMMPDVLNQALDHSGAQTDPGILELQAAIDANPSLVEQARQAIAYYEQSFDDEIEFLANHKPGTSWSE